MMAFDYQGGDSSSDSGSSADEEDVSYGLVDTTTVTCGATKNGSLAMERLCQTQSSAMTIVHPKGRRRSIWFFLRAEVGMVTIFSW
jgi:hypothetical protein